MKGRAIGNLRCPNQADAEDVRDDITTWIAANDGIVWLTDQPAVATLSRDGWHVGFDVRFDTRQGADQLYQRIQQVWSSPQFDDKILVGSVISLHTCEHDDSYVNHCRTSGADYVEAVKS